MNADDLIFYQTYKTKRSFLQRIQALYYATERKLTPAQAEKFEAIRAGLLADLRMIYPGALDKGFPIYLLDAIEAVLWNQRQEEREQNERMIANGAMARTQLKAWDWPGLK